MLLAGTSAPSPGKGAIDCFVHCFCQAQGHDYSQDQVDRRRPSLIIAPAENDGFGW